MNKLTVDLRTDIIAWLLKNPKKYDKGGTDLAWYDTRDNFIKYLVKKGYCRINKEEK